MGNEAVIENRVTLVEDINVVTDLNFERALDNYVKLLTVMGAELDGSILLLFKIRELYKEGLGKLILEFGCKVIINKAFFLNNFKALAFSCYCERGKS